MVKITVFTPTFNRGYLLSRCYDSLKKQVHKDFIWQIIDDGSTDDTENIVKKFMKENIIHIEYFKKKNGGKAETINFSLARTYTDYWVCLDSDDYFCEKAMEVIKKSIAIIDLDDSICGLISLRCTKYNRPMQGKNFPLGIEYATQYDIRYKMRIEPEYAQIYKTSVIKKYLYPIVNGEKYVPLSYVPDQIDQKYKLLLVRDPIMICEYQNDGITKNQKKIAVLNPEGFKLCMIQRMIIRGNIFFKSRACITYIVMCLISKDKNILKKSPKKVLTLICTPIAIADYFIRYKKYTN